MPFVVSLQPEPTQCWLCKVSGDPGRTMVLASASRWKTRKQAESALARAKRENPHRHFRAAEVVEVEA